MKSRRFWSYFHGDFVVNAPLKLKGFNSHNSYFRYFVKKKKSPQKYNSPSAVRKRRILITACLLLRFFLLHPQEILVWKNRILKPQASGSKWESSETIFAQRQFGGRGWTLSLVMNKDYNYVSRRRKGKEVNQSRERLSSQFPRRSPPDTPSKSGLPPKSFSPTLEATLDMPLIQVRRR